MNVFNEKEYHRKYRQEHPEIYREATKKWRKNHPEKASETHRKVNNTYRKNHPEIKKAQHLAEYHCLLDSKCLRCGSTENLERHHPDYLEPLWVQTLCISCHSLITRLYRISHRG